MTRFPQLVVNTALQEVSFGDSLLLYGSCARGDYDTNSDIDLLRITKGRACARRLDQRTTLHVYDIDDLITMAQNGSLFVLHLVEEAISIEDSRGYLDMLASRFTRPSSYLSDARMDLSAATSLLDVQESLFNRAPKGFANAAVYLCRTLVYAEHADRGAFSFSLRKLAEYDPVAAILFSFRERSISFADFSMVREIVKAKMGLETETLAASTVKELRVKSQHDPLFESLLCRIIKGGMRAKPYSFRPVARTASISESRLQLQGAPFKCTA